MKPVVVAFDFDGTITSKDTFIEFIWFTKGSGKLILGLALYAPLLICWKLKLYPNWKIKQQLFSFFFKGMPVTTFNQYCENFCHESQHFIRPKAIEAIQQYAEKQAKMIIVSASIDNWVKPFAQKLKIPIVLGTQIEIDLNNLLTGRFSSPNCYGQEKINRILQHYPNRSEYHLIAYGDSLGDRPMLEFADEQFYRALE